MKKNQAFYDKLVFDEKYIYDEEFFANLAKFWLAVF